MPKRYPSGIYFNNPYYNAPDFVIGKISIKSNEFLEWFNSEAPNEKGYVYLDVLKSKDGKPYCAVNDFVPKEIYKASQPGFSTKVTGDDGEDLPF